MSADPRPNLHVMDAAHEQAPNGNGQHEAGEYYIQTPQWTRLVTGSLTLAEQAALHYIIDRVIGWHAQRQTGEAAIPYSHFLRGRCSTQTGEVIDTGCGIKNPTNLRRALHGLEGKGLITVAHQDGRTSRYRLTPPATTTAPVEVTGAATTTAPVEDLYSSGSGTSTASVEVHYRSGSGTTTAPVDNKDKGKKRTKEILKDTLKDDDDAGADAPHTPSPQSEQTRSGATDPSRRVGAHAQQLSFAHQTPHGVALHPSEGEPSLASAARAPRDADRTQHHQPSEGDRSPNAEAAGPRPDKTKGKTKPKAVKVSLVPQDDEPDDVWGAKMYLSQVPRRVDGFGWPEAWASVLEHWRGLCADIVPAMGREQFARFVRYHVGEPWLAEDTDRIMKVGVPWLTTEIGQWEKLSPAEQAKTKAQRKAELKAREEPRSGGKRDSGRVSNAIRDVADVVPWCPGCTAEQGTPHYDHCDLFKWELIGPGDVVTDEHCDVAWATERARAWNAAHPPKPKAPAPPPEERPRCCGQGCGATLGEAHGVACALHRQLSLAAGSFVTPEHCNPDQVGALIQAHIADANPRGRELMRQWKKEHAGV